MSKAYTSSNYDGKSVLQLQIVITEDSYSSTGSSSRVIAEYYFIAVNQPVNRLSGNVDSDYGTSQTITCRLGSVSKTFTTNAYAIADAINSFGDRMYIGTITTTVNRNASGGANINASASCTLTWRSGYPSRNVTANYPCTKLKSTVTYDANGGTNAVNSEYKYYGYILALTQVPTRAGYKFLGWSTSKSRNDIITSYSSDSNITLYAIWEILEFDIAFTPKTIRLLPYFFVGINGFKYFTTEATSQLTGVNFSFDMSGVTDFTISPITEKGRSFVCGNKYGYFDVSSTCVMNTLRETGVTQTTDIDGNTTDVLPIQFVIKCKINGTSTSFTRTVDFPIEDYKPFDIQTSSVWADTTGENLVYFKFLVTYPPSFNPSVQAMNVEPPLLYNNMLLTLVEKTINNDGTILVTCNLDANNLTKLTPASTLNKRGIKMTGGGYDSGEGNMLLRYQVTPGEQIYLNLAEPKERTSGAAATYLFQNTDSVHTTKVDLVGTPVGGVVKDIVTVPEGATWLIVSQLTTTATNVVSRYSDNMTVATSYCNAETPYDKIANRGLIAGVDWEVVDNVVQTKRVIQMGFGGMMYALDGYNLQVTRYSETSDGVYSQTSQSDWIADAYFNEGEFLKIALKDTAEKTNVEPVSSCEKHLMWLRESDSTRTWYPHVYSDDGSVVTPQETTMLISTSGECSAKCFIETDYVQGFLRGGVACAKEFVEGDEIIFKPDGFTFNEIKEV